MSAKPKVSVFTTCKNSEKYFSETIQSILDQTFKDLEIVIVDAASTDETLNLIKNLAAKDPRVRWISESDRDATEGFYKAIQMTGGEYIFCLPISDFYVSKNWIEKCVQALDQDPQVSLVHGIPVNMNEAGALYNVPFHDWLKKPLPGKKDFTAFYLATYCVVSEITFGVRRSVMLECYPKWNSKEDYEALLHSKNINEKQAYDPFLNFLLEFFKRGYLAIHLPYFATAGRTHDSSRNLKFADFLVRVGSNYVKNISILRESIFSGATTYVWRDGKSQVIGTMTGDELKKFKSKVWKYRLLEKHMYGHIESFSVRLLIRIISILKAIDPKERILKLFFKN